MPKSIQGNFPKYKVDSVADMELLNAINNDIAFVTGYYAKNDGGGGEFYYDSSSVVASDNGTVFGTGTGRWIRIFSGEVNILWFGAKGDGVDYESNSSRIQLALDGFSNIYAPEGVYNISDNLYMDSPEGFEKKLRGDGMYATQFYKYTNNLGSGSNIAPSAVTDSYAVDSIITIRHPDSQYAFNVTIKDLRIKGSNDNSIGLFAPRTSHTRIENVHIKNTIIGWKTFDTWDSKFDMVQVQSLYSGASTSMGFQWTSNGDNVGRGTTLDFSNCWVRDCDGGYVIKNVKYSAMNNCGADHINKNNKSSNSACSYSFDLCDIVLNGCGTEDMNIGANQSVIRLAGGSYVFNVFHALDISNVSTGTMIFSDAASSRWNSCDLRDFNTATGTNIVVQNGSKMFSDANNFPNNGNNYTSMSGDSFVLTDGRFLRISESDNSRDYMGGFGTVDLTIRKNETITNNLDLFTIEVPSASISTGFTSVRWKFQDTAFASGAGEQEFKIGVYRESSSSYRDSTTTVFRCVVGNSISAPSLLVTQSGTLWTVSAVLPSGTITAERIEIDYDSNVTINWLI